MPPRKSRSTIGGGKFKYTLDPTWGVLPEGMKYGLGCGIVVDSEDRIYITSRSASPCVAIFTKNGKLHETWSKDFSNKVGYENVNQVAATAHGIYWSKEGDKEYLYFTENVSAGRKTATQRIGIPRLQDRSQRQGALHHRQRGEGNRYLAEVRLDPRLHRRGRRAERRYLRRRWLRLPAYPPAGFDKNFKLIKTIGGPGTEHGKFKTCHGVWVSTLNKEPEVYIADRANGRYEVFDLELTYKRTVSGPFVRNPCCFYQHDGHLYIPDLGERSWRSSTPRMSRWPVLGDGKGIKPAGVRKGASRQVHRTRTRPHGRFARGTCTCSSGCPTAACGSSRRRRETTKYARR